MIVTKNTNHILVRQEWLNTAIWAIGRLLFVINMKGELIFCVKSPTYLRLYDHWPAVPLYYCRWAQRLDFFDILYCYQNVMFEEKKKFKLLYCSRWSQRLSESDLLKKETTTVRSSPKPRCNNIIFINLILQF